jgi:uncharacterized Zn-binding protein involved in type VI secretion
MPSKRFSAALVALACVGALSACGTDAATTTASLTKESFASNVAAATAQATSVHVSGHVSAEGMAVAIHGDLAVNGATLKDLVARLEVTSAMPRASATLLLTDGKAYLKTSGLPMPTKSSKPWLEADLTGAGSPVAAHYKAMMSQLDPALLVKAFRATTQVKRVGPATVAGVNTTHYVVTVDTAKVLRLLGTQKLVGSHAQEAQKYLPKTFAYDVWLDSASRPVRIKAAYSGVAVDLTFTSWGQPVSVQAPPASRVSKISL